MSSLSTIVVNQTATSVENSTEGFILDRLEQVLSTSEPIELVNPETFTVDDGGDESQENLVSIEDREKVSEKGVGPEMGKGKFLMLKAKKRDKVVINGLVSTNQSDGYRGFIGHLPKGKSIG